MSDKIALQNKKTPPKKFENGERLPLIWVRAGCLLIVALLGIPFAECIISFLPERVDEKLKDSVQLKILLLSLPVLCVLWHFRTTDIQKQIQEARENAEAAREGVKATREALNADTLGRYLSMLFSENLSARCVGLIRLAEIKRQGKFAEEINSATRRQINLNEAKLQEEDLSGLDLRGAQLNKAELYDTILVGADLRYAKMCGAYLFSTKLMGADLRGVDFTGAKFMDANLRGARLQNANLTDAVDLNLAELEGAEFSAGTKFPRGFDYDEEGMVRKNEP